MFNKYKKRKEIALYFSITKNIQQKYQFSGSRGEKRTLTSSQSDMFLHVFSVLSFNQELFK